MYSWQENTAQVEFLLEKEGEVIPIEVKAGKVTKAKSLGVFAAKYKPPYSVVLSGKPHFLNPDRSSKAYPLYLAGFF